MSNRARRLAATVSGGLLVGSLVLAGCGRGGAPQPVTAGAPGAASAAAAGSPAGPLPTLPPVQQRNPELFDDHGCARTGPTDASCSSTAADIDRSAAAPGPGQRLAGYVGPAYSADPPTGTVVVLDATASSAPTADGRWSATGLVRNQRADLIGGASVRADLIGADGSVIESVGGDALVHPLRAGEPAPFTLTAAMAKAARVASVRWSAEARSEAVDGAADARTRQIELQTYWTRLPTDPKAVDNYLLHDPATGAKPLVVFGSMTSVGPVAIARPHLVAAWSDDAGRIVAVREVSASAPTGEAAGELGVGGFDDFLLAVPASELPPGAELSTPMLWGYGA